MVKTVSPFCIYHKQDHFLLYFNILACLEEESRCCRTIIFCRAAGSEMNSGLPMIPKSISGQIFSKIKAMKIFTCLFIMTISAYTVTGQTYLITFTGSGASNTVDSVKVENLSSAPACL